MRILRNLLYIVAIVGGIVLASANMTPVRFIYLPGLAFVSSREPAEVEVPLALLLLGFLLIGALVAGTGTFVEHLRLRFLVRRNAKVVKGLRAELDKARAELEQAEATIASRASDLAAEQARAKKAEQAQAMAEEAHAKALATAEQERARADEAAGRLSEEAARALVPPPGA